MSLYIDAGTTWSKIIEINENDFASRFAEYKIKNEYGKNYYIMPSNIIKQIGIKFDNATGHMDLGLLKDKNNSENEIIALANGAKKYIKDENALVFDLGSRDAKWIKFQDGKFKDLDWNTSCASSTGATVEMLLKFYDVKVEDLKFNKEKYVVNCGIFGLEKIMDDVAKGELPTKCIEKFIHGIAYNAWNFAKKPQKIYLSGGFCQNQCFVESLKNYCEVATLGRFILVESFIKFI